MAKKVLTRINLALLLLLVPALAEVSVVGTDVFLEPPGEYRAGDSYTGLEAADGSWWLMVMEAPVPVPVEELLARMTDSALAEKGMTVLDREQFETRHGPATLITVMQKQNGSVYEKLVLVVGDETRSVTVTAGFLFDSSEELRNSILASLGTVRLAGKSAGVNPDGLPFTFQESADLVVAQRALAYLILIPAGDEKMESGVFLGLSALEPGVGVKPEAVMRSELESVYSDLQAEQSKTLEMHGTSAMEVLASGLDSETSQEVSIYYYLIPGQKPGLYFAAFGETPRGAMNQWLKKFQAVSHTVRSR